MFSSSGLASKKASGGMCFAGYTIFGSASPCSSKLLPKYSHSGIGVALKGRLVVYIVP